ncbi:Smr/MutS family protein [Chitinibacter sp. S2-10]|uniref:Smr/MutS family protein n=1 Tax=Chitinibacter sp. S2-10 TaxID=3373597 RepID=UPI00397733BD
MDKTTLVQLKQLRKRLKQQQDQSKSASVPIPAVVDDHILFEQAMKGVKPLDYDAHYLHPAPVISPWPRNQNPAPIAQPDDMSDCWPWDELIDGEQLLFSRPGLRLDQLRKLKRGHWMIDAELDLHGETIDSARAKVAHFLMFCVARQLRCVRIIHGKGLSSKDGQPILKLKLKNWLVQRGEVLAFAQANPFQGCAGAVLVLLKSGSP